MDGPPDLSIRVRASRQLLCLLGALHALALLGLAGVAAGCAQQGLLALVLLASMAWHVRDFVCRQRAGGIAVDLRDSQCWLHDARGLHAMALRDDTTVLPFCVVLRLQQGRRVRTVVIFPDALERAECRRLRVLLRLWTGTGLSGKADSGQA